MRRLPRALAVVATVLLVVVAIAAVAVRVTAANRVAPGPIPGGDPALRLDRLQAACVADMVASTCRVMGATAPDANTLAQGTVYIAGVGALDAQAYAQLYEAGEAMCAVVRDACRADWDSPRCATARAVFAAG